MHEEMLLKGRRAVVTGAGRGSGRAIALHLARAGAAVAVVARSKSQIESTAAEIQRDGGSAWAVAVDVTSDESVNSAFPVIREALGGPVDTLVNNAGAYTARTFLDYSMDDWHSLLDVNVLGTVRMTRKFLPEMLSLPRARIINLASIAGKKASFGQSAYNATKHALIGITRCLALETGASNLRVNAVCPGFTKTEMIDIDQLSQVHGKSPEDLWRDIENTSTIRRTVSLDEIASLVMFLTTAAADGINGQSLVVDGGVVFS